MEIPMKTPLMTALIAVALVTIPTYAAHAADHQVMMLNKDSEGRAMQFEPAFLKVVAGDTVTFVVTDKTHNSESIAKAIPAGAEGWKGKINQEVKVTFETEGFYAYKCLPHVGMGMVGLIQVGEPGAPDEAIAKTVPGKGKTRMLELIAQAQGQ
jgi:pseudoazurin